MSLFYCDALLILDTHVGPLRRLTIQRTELVIEDNTPEVSKYPMRALAQKLAGLAVPHISPISLPPLPHGVQFPKTMV